MERFAESQDESAAEEAQRQREELAEKLRALEDEQGGIGEAAPLRRAMETKNHGKGDLPPSEEIHAERERGREILREEARDELARTWEQTSKMEAADRRNLREQALREYEADASRWYGVNPNIHKFEIADNEQMQGASGSWNRETQTLKVNEGLLDLDSPDEAVATVKHELSHCRDDQRGESPVHHFQELPEPPHPGAKEGKLQAEPGDTPEMKDAEYEKYAKEYEQYLSKWDEIDDTTLAKEYVAPPEAPLEPAPGSRNAETRYEQLGSHYEGAFGKYERSAGERQARQQEKLA